MCFFNKASKQNAIIIPLKISECRLVAWMSPCVFGVFPSTWLILWLLIEQVQKAGPVSNAHSFKRGSWQCWHWVDEVQMISMLDKLVALMTCMRSGRTTCLVNQGDFVCGLWKHKTSCKLEHKYCYLLQGAPRPCRKGSCGEDAKMFSMMIQMNSDRKHQGNPIRSSSCMQARMFLHGKCTWW